MRSTNITRTARSTRTARATAVLATLSLFAAACGSDSNDTTEAPTETVAPADDAPADDAMDDDAMDDDAMDDEAMDDEAMDDEAMDDDAMDDEAMDDDAMDDDAMDDDAMDDDTMDEDQIVADATTDDGASTLRATLTALLQEHVYLAGIAIETAIDAGGDLEQPAVVAAVDALDANSVTLADTVGAVAGDENGEAFLGLWREHIGFFVDYTLGAATGDDAAKQTALTNLDGYEEAAGAFFEQITGGAISADDLVAGLGMHVTTLTEAIDAVVAGDPAAFGELREAAQHMFGSALFLATGIAEALPETFPGDVTSAPSETRAVLTNLLQEHVYLAGIAIEQAVEVGGDLEQPAVEAAVAALDVNSVELSEVIGSVAGPDNAEAFLGLWREHIGFFVDYTLGVATGDEAMAEQALTDLSGYQQAAGAFFEEITAGELPADALVANLDGHISTLTATIDSLVAGDGQVFALLREAAAHMSSSALALSTAVIAATS